MAKEKKIERKAETASKKELEESKEDSDNKTGESREQAKNIAEKQVKWIFVFIVGILAVFILVFAVIKEDSKFEYQGTDFEKTSQGKIVFYTAKVPAINENGQVVAYKEIDFRNDPRKITGVEISIIDGIRFSNDRKVYVSVDDPIEPCKDNALSMVNLARLLASFNRDVKGAINNASYKDTNTSQIYANCETNPDSTVIRIRNGNETKIVQTAENCYEIISSNCEILKAAEKFELIILEQYASRFKAA